MNTSDTFYNSLEKSGNEMFNLIDFTDLKHFLELSQKESFFDTVSKRPELK
jgi:hypothetical protein